MTNHSINYSSYIDHTLLAMDATEQQIDTVCQQALQYKFYSVCVNSGYVPLVHKLLAGSDVKTCSVVGFPLGASLTPVKVFETQCAIAEGADEIDMVINIGWFKSGNLAAVRADIQAVFVACGTIPLKVILETALLEPNEIRTLCEICRDIGVAFVKTSTGFCNKGGASVEAIRIMRETVGKNIGVKASGGIRDRNTADNMIQAGANRLGTSASVAIVTGENNTTSNY